MEADGENKSKNYDDQNYYKQHTKEFINNIAVAPQERPDIKQWMEHREKTIETVDELRTKLDIVCVGANCGKGFASGTQITGAVTSIIGAAMALGNYESAVQVMNFGSLINNSGAFVGGVTNMVESYVSAEYLQNVKYILNKDKELSQPLQKWLTSSKTIDENMKIIFGSDLNSGPLKNVVKVFSEFSVLYDSVKGFHETLKEMKKGKFSMHIGNTVQVEKLFKFSKELEECPRLRDIMLKLNESINFEVAKDGVKVYQNLYGKSALVTKSIQENQKSKVSANPSIQGDGNVESTSNDEAEIQSVKAISAFCFFQTIYIAESVISLISAITIIKDGKSKFSKALKKISDCLQNELESIKLSSLT